MNGVYCSSRPMRVSVATDRNSRPRTQMGAMTGGYVEEEGTNTTVFVGGLDASTVDEDLRAHFSAIGEVRILHSPSRSINSPTECPLQIVSVKVPPGRGCGFVQYGTKEAAEMAITQMNGTVINGAKVRCAWGRSAAARALAGAGGNPNTYYQQYGYAQQYGQNYYAYGGAYYQQYQQGAAGAYAGYGAYAGGYPQGQPQQQGGYHQGQHGHYNGHHHHQRPQQQQQERDFTRPDDVDAMNRRYASQRAYQVRQVRHGQPAAFHGNAVVTLT